MEPRIFANRVAVALEHKNCGALTRLLNLKPTLIEPRSTAKPPGPSFAIVVEEYLKTSNVDADVAPAWKHYILSHVHSRICILNGNLEIGFDHLIQAMQQWLIIYEGQTNAWLIPVTGIISFNLVDVAIMADRQSEVSDPHLSTHKHCFEAREILETAFGLICRSGRKASGLAVSNALCKLYFKLDELQMAVVFQTRVESQLTLAFNEFPRVDRVIWKYYNGLIALDRMKFREAEICLSYALDHTPRTERRNLQKILFLLIPLRLLYNEFPKESAVNAYGLNRLLDVVRAVRQGRLDLFSEYLKSNGPFLMSMRLWTLMQKLIHVVHRNVMFKCYRFHLEMESELPSHQMDLKLFAAGLRVSGDKDTSVKDGWDVAKSLIQKDMVCGYLASQRQLLVLSKNGPFPRLRDINLEAGELFFEPE